MLPGTRRSPPTPFSPTGQWSSLDPTVAVRITGPVRGRSGCCDGADRANSSSYAKSLMTSGPGPPQRRTNVRGSTRAHCSRCTAGAI